MKKTDKSYWYRNSNWSKKEQVNFFLQLHRSKSEYHKAQYAYLKALSLIKRPNRRNLDGAMDLLKLVTNTYHEVSLQSSAYLAMANIYLKRKDQSNIVEAYKNSIQWMESCPNIKCMAKEDFIQYILKNKNESLYCLAMKLANDIEADHPFLASQFFIMNSCRAIVNFKEGRPALIEAREALKYVDMKKSIFKGHPRIGLVDVKSNTSIIRQLNIILKSA